MTIISLSLESSLSIFDSSVSFSSEVTTEKGSKISRKREHKNKFYKLDIKIYCHKNLFHSFFLNENVNKNRLTS